MEDRLRFYGQKDHSPQHSFQVGNLIHRNAKAVTTDETVQTLDKETGDIRDITPDVDFDAEPDQEPEKLGTFVTEDGEIINLDDEAAQESLFEERTIKPKD